MDNQIDAPANEGKVKTNKVSKVVTAYSGKEFDDTEMNHSDDSIEFMRFEGLDRLNDPEYKYNVIYGSNGVGKTTLGRFFSKRYHLDNHGDKSHIYFSPKFEGNSISLSPHEILGRSEYGSLMIRGVNSESKNYQLIRNQKDKIEELLKDKELEEIEELVIQDIIIANGEVFKPYHTNNDKNNKKKQHTACQLLKSAANKTKEKLSILINLSKKNKILEIFDVYHNFLNFIVSDKFDYAYLSSLPKEKEFKDLCDEMNKITPIDSINDALKNNFGFEDYPLNPHRKIFNPDINSQEKLNKINNRAEQHDGITNSFYLNESRKNIIVIVSCVERWVAKFKQSNIDDKYIVVFDDIISSTDDVNSMNICDYIVNFLVDNDKYIEKAIILTHKFDSVMVFVKKIRNKVKEKRKELEDKIEKLEDGQPKTKEKKEQLNKLKNSLEVIKVGIRELRIKNYKNHKKSKNSGNYPVIELITIEKEDEERFLWYYRYCFDYVYEKAGKEVNTLNCDVSRLALVCRQLLEMFCEWCASDEKFNDKIFEDIDIDKKNERWEGFLSSKELKKLKSSELKFPENTKELHDYISNMIHKRKSGPYSASNDGEVNNPPQNSCSVYDEYFHVYTLGVIYVICPHHYNRYKNRNNNKSKDQNKNHRPNNPKHNNPKDNKIINHEDTTNQREQIAAQNNSL